MGKGQEQNQTLEAFFVKPKNKLKAKYMRLDVLMALVSGIFSYDQMLCGKGPKY